MHKISRFFPYLFIHLLIGLIGCCVYAFLWPIKETLLPNFLFSWKITKSILRFIFYSPFIYASSLIFGYSIIFGKFGPIKMERRSPDMIRFIQHFFILSLVVLSLYIVLAEVVKPILMEKQALYISQTLTYKEYTKLAKEAYKRNDYSQAGEHITRALSIWPKSEEAMKLDEKITIAREKLALDKNDSVFLKTSQKTSGVDNMTPEAALKKAKASVLSLDFYTAHYYAKLAVQTFEDENPLRLEAENIAKNSWKQIEKGLSSYQDAPLIEIYQNKRAAYEALQNGNYIKAYYSFLQIDSTLRYLDADQKDPELERFLNFSRIELQKNVFFTDELKNIPNFLIKGDINFKIAEGSDEYAKIKIHGTSHCVSNSRDEIYLMNTFYTRLGKSDTEEWKIFIPYSKLIEVVDKKGKTKLMLQICSVDRYSEKKTRFPKVLAGELPMENEHNILLPMTMADFHSIEKAVRGPAGMKISDLYYFSLIGKKYGLKKEVYLSEVLYRLTEPILLLIVSLIIIILAWRFRFSPEKRFKKRQFIFFPLFPFLSYILVEIARYIFKLQIAFFVVLTPKYVSLIIFSVPLIFLILLIIGLVYQRSE